MAFSAFSLQLTWYQFANGNLPSLSLSLFSLWVSDRSFADIIKYRVRGCNRPIPKKAKKPLSLHILFCSMIENALFHKEQFCARNPLYVKEWKIQDWIIITHNYNSFHANFGFLAQENTTDDVFYVRWASLQINMRFTSIFSTLHWYFSVKPLTFPFRTLKISTPTYAKKARTMKI